MKKAGYMGHGRLGVWTLLSVLKGHSRLMFLRATSLP
jgi:hypothetical protein